MFKLKIAIITMLRKGSKRLPNKCIKILNGKPLFYYTVNIALKLKEHLDGLGIDTNYYLLHDYDNLELENYFDIERIKKIKEIKRLPQFTGDIHRTNEEIKYYNIDANIYIFLQATNPIRKLCDLLKWLNAFITEGIPGGYECAFAAKKIEKFVYDIAGNEINFQSEFRTDNGCKKESIFIETGNCYMFFKKMLDRIHLLYSDKRMILEDQYLCDIDKEENLLEAEILLKELEND